MSPLPNQIKSQITICNVAYPLHPSLIDCQRSGTTQEANRKALAFIFWRLEFSLSLKELLVKSTEWQ